MMSSRLKRHAVDKAGRDALLGRVADFLGTCPAEILAAYAFGSFARAEPFRDLEVALLMATSAPEPLAFELSLEGDLEKLLRIPVDVRILNYAPQPFQYSVIREGRLVLDRDPNRRAAFEGNVIKQYLDFSRFRRRSLKEIANAEI